MIGFMNLFHRKADNRPDTRSRVDARSARAQRRRADRWQLGDLQALVLIGAIFMMPIALLTYDVIDEHNKQIRFAEKELRGAEHAAVLRDMQQQLLRHRGLVDRVLGGENSELAGQAAARATLRKTITALDALDARYGGEWASKGPWAAIKASWTKLDASLGRLDVDESMSLVLAKRDVMHDWHRDIFKELELLIARVAETSNLVLDPDLEVNSVSQILIFSLPTLTLDLAEIRYIGGNVASAGTVTTNDRLTFAIQGGLAKDQLDKVEAEMAAIFRADPALNNKIGAKYTATVASVREVLHSIALAFESADRPQVTPEDWYGLATKAVDDLYGLGDAIAPEQKKLLQTRAAVLKKDQIRTLSITTGLMLLALVIVALLGRRLLASIRERGERAARDAETNRRNQAAILRLMDEMGPIAAGNLTAQATVDEEITGAVADAVNATVADLRGLVAGVTDTAGHVAHGAASAQKITQQLLAAAQKQAHDIERAGGAVELITKSISEVSSSATQSAEAARKSLATAERGAGAVQSSVKSMNLIREQIQDTAKRIKRLGESSQEIGEIVELISDITEQTNVLALNAAIQAASAGEAGRGFAVVAEEVQRLAERSAEAMKQIGALVKAIQTDTHDAVAAMEKSTQGVVQGAQLSDAAGAALGEIESATRELSQLVQSIAVSTQMQVEIAREVTSGMKQTLAITEQATRGVNQTAATVADLAAHATNMKSSVARFKVA
jgi:methyl-accepting chemotaxis protein